METTMTDTYAARFAPPDVALRALDETELDQVTGGALNCFPIIGEDGKMYSPTLDGYPGGPLRDLSGAWRFPLPRPLF
jgi:hypothetical protein